MAIHTIRRLKSCENGTSVLEFALGLPILIMIMTVGMELSWNAIQQQRIQALANQAADNAARVRYAIDETDIEEIFASTEKNGQSLDFSAHGRLIISSIQRNSLNNGEWIRWQRCYGSKAVSSNYGPENTGRNDDSLTGVGSDKSLKAPPGSAVIIAEVVYDYQPIIDRLLFSDKTYRYEAAFVVRDRNDLSIGNSTSLPSGKIHYCT